MTQKLPRTVKKKLEASLENLTPRQAGRLFLIYSGEYDKNPTAPSFWEYPPIVDLMDAWKRRTDAAKAKKGEIERQGVALHNGFLTLTELIRESNRYADAELWRLSTVSVAAMSRLHELLLRDTLSEIARYTIANFTQDVPRPLDRQEYDKAVAWYENFSPVTLDAITDEIMNNWEEKLTEERGFTDAPDLEAFWEAHKEEFDAEHYYQVETTEELRSRFAEVEGDKALKKYFKGDRALFAEWIKTGFFGLYQSEYEAKRDEVFAHLVEMVKAGDLEGGVCYSLRNTWGYIPAQGWNTTEPEEILKVNLPAWAVLRAIWEDWLYDKGFLKGDELRFDDFDFADPMVNYYDVEGSLEGERLTATAKAFYLECRKKPWGAGLVDPKKVDFGRLGCFLCIDETPLLGYYAPDLGRVAVASLWEADGDTPFLEIENGKDTPPPFDWYATLRGSRAKAGELGVSSEVDKNYIQEFYYPTDDPVRKRKAIARIFRQLDTLRVSHRPFTYREKDKREMPSFLGLEFFTPLEEAVKTLGEAFHQVDTFKLTYELLSQEFFDGLPILMNTLQERLKQIEETLSVAEARLNQFLDALASPTWNVDTSSLRLVKKGPNENTAKFWAAAFIAVADKDHDNDKRPAWLDNGETFEQIMKRLTGLDYKGLNIAGLRKRAGR